MFRLRRPRFPLHTARRALAVALGVVALVLALRPGKPPPDPVIGTVPVTVAARNLPGGAVLTADQLVVARLPAALAPEGVSADPADLVGRVLAGGIRAGEPLTDVRLVGAGLSALLPAGQVATPIRLADLGVAALVRTGDRVDVLATPPDSATADVVAAGALVLSAPVGGGAQSDPAAGLLVLAVDPVTAARLAAASTAATLTVTLPRRDE